MSELYSVHTLAYPYKEVAYHVSSIDLPLDYIQSNRVNNGRCVVVAHLLILMAGHLAALHVSWVVALACGRWSVAEPIRTLMLAEVDNRPVNRAYNVDRDLNRPLVDSTVIDMVVDNNLVDVDHMDYSMLADMWDNAIGAYYVHMDPALEWVTAKPVVVVMVVDNGMYVVFVVLLRHQLIE